MSEEKPESRGGDVIHVRFGPAGGRRTEPPPPPPEMEEKASPAAKSSPRSTEPYGDLFRRDEVARLFGIPEGRLRYWDRSSFISPSARRGRRRLYTFQDLVGIRAAKQLLGQGATLAMIRRSLHRLNEILPTVTRPLNELKVTTDGASLLVRELDHHFDPQTGQLALDFELSALRDDVVRLLRPDQPDPERRRRAYESYLEGCRLDEDETSFDRAEECYRRAIELDPKLANALTNWGNLCFRRGENAEAEALYRRALAIDEGQPEALYNLGFLAHERGELARAVDCFQRAADHDPGFADAHFNLAMALEEQGRREAARSHWEHYLELDPAGPWAQIAREHLSGQPLPKPR